MKIKDIKIGMYVTCKTKHNDLSNLHWTDSMSKAVGKPMKVSQFDLSHKFVKCASFEGEWWYEPDWLSPWEEEQKGLVGYYQGIDLTGLDRDIVTRMAVNNNDLCSSKIYNMIAKLNRCKQENPKTARLVDNLIKELVDILDLHEHEEKKDNLPLNNQIEILREENKKLKEDIEFLQKKKNGVKISKTCVNCKYYVTPMDSFPCKVCSIHSHWQPDDIYLTALKKKAL